MLEVEARQAVKWYPFTSNSTLYDLVSFLEDALTLLEPSFCASVS